jgi:NADH dehydrogenase (ubiquinone) Fe-S protein 1
MLTSHTNTRLVKVALPHLVHLFIHSNYFLWLQHLGDKVETIDAILNGKHDFSKTLNSAKKPIIIVGSTALQRTDGAVILAKIQKMSANLRAKGQIPSDWRVLNVLHRVASQVAALDLGYAPGAQKIRDTKPKVLFMIGADESVISRSDLAKDCFVIYQG